MYLRYFIAVITILVFCTSCIDDDLGGPNATLTFADVEMVIKGKYDDEAFVKNRIYSYAEGSKVRFSHFNFFVSELTASLNAEETFALDEIEYVDLALFEGEKSALSGYKLNIGKAPIGNYNGFSFGVGLTPELNATTPDEYGVNHPLGDVDRYDSNLNGYEFLTVAGEVDHNGDGTFDDTFNFVVGFNQNYRTIASTRGIDILEDVTNNVTIEVDLKKILDNGIRSIDFPTQLNTSINPSDEIMLLLNSNIAGAITVN